MSSTLAPALGQPVQPCRASSRPPDPGNPESETPTWQPAFVGDKGLETERCDSAVTAAEVHEKSIAGTGAVCLDRTAAVKPWLRLQAECLMAGFPASLIDGDNGKPLLVVSRWALCRSFSSAPEAEAWLARVGVRTA